MTWNTNKKQRSTEKKKTYEALVYLFKNGNRNS